MSPLKILFPYNFTEYDKKALAFINQTFSRLEEVDITIFTVYTPVTELETGDDSVMSRMLSNLGFLRQKILEQENELKSVQRQLQNGLDAQKVRYVFRPRRKKDVASEIIDMALEENFTILVLNRKPIKIARFFTGSIFNKIVAALPGKTVCIVS